MPVHLEYMPDFDLLISYSYGSVSMDEILSSIDTIYQNKVYKDAMYCIIYVDTKEYLYEIKDSEVVVEKMMKYSKSTKRKKDAFIQEVDVSSSGIIDDLVFGSVLYSFHSTCDGKVNITLATGNYFTSIGKDMDLGL